MLEATDEFLAKSARSATPDLKLKDAARKKIRDMWKKIA